MSDSELYIAVDLGAGSGRVFLAGFAPGELLLEEMRRFHYPMSLSAGHLRWDFPCILENVLEGARDSASRARELGRPVRSIGVDSWGVDYGLVDDAGALLELPVCYRDERTRGVMEEVFTRVARDVLFERTGIQIMTFNTLFQLWAHVREGLPDAAGRLLMIPDLVHLQLTGRAVTEYTNATTTQMLDPRTRTWDRRLLEDLGLPGRLLAELVPPGTDLGPLRPELAETLGLQGVRVTAPATHDTGSAFAGAPLRDGWAYVSSGTWSLVGVERDSVLINPEVARANFTNEGGAFGTIRFLKNVTGLWLLESCRREWKDRGFDVHYGRLLEQVEARDDFPGLIFPDDPALLNPPSMVQAIGEQLRTTGQPAVAEPSGLAKIILDSLALRYASVIAGISRLTGREIEGIHIGGGGSRNRYLNQAAATAAARPVLAGPAEATATGNALVQAIAAGRFASLSRARRHLDASVPLQRYEPRPSAAWEEAARRYASIEARWESPRG